jgi:hypothetical protein
MNKNKAAEKVCKTVQRILDYDEEHAYTDKCLPPLSHKLEMLFLELSSDLGRWEAAEECDIS